LNSSIILILLSSNKIIKQQISPMEKTYTVYDMNGKAFTGPVCGQTFTKYKKDVPQGYKIVEEHSYYLAYAGWGPGDGPALVMKHTKEMIEKI